MDTMELAWTPGAGGLLGLVPVSALPTVIEEDLPLAARPVRPLHVTLLRSASMAPLVECLGPDWDAIRETLPPVPLPRLSGRLRKAQRPPHPDKDPPGETRPRRTWFLAAREPAALQAALGAVVRALDAASRARGGPPFPHPEPDRFFHVSLFNDRGGDPTRSIGDIGPRDR